jgi:hypothetical protein
VTSSQPDDDTDPPDDVAQLRREHPAWNFGTVWATAASGPDARRLWAFRDGALLSAWTAAELCALVRLEEVPGQPDLTTTIDQSWP